MSVDPDPSAETELFGPYEIYERLGKGGMAMVHRAKKRGIAGFERVVALKRMLPHFADDANFVDSFIREAKVASLLVHPNIAQIYDFGRIDGTYYIAMEHVVGFDMRKVLRHTSQRREQLPIGVVLSILCELCDALEYAHTFADETGTPLGIVHRDVSPSNLIVAQTGHLKVIDFGIAKASTSQLHTESGRVKGKLGYMSPEAAMGYVLGPVSNVFSVGVVAHELLTSVPLFTSKTDFETMVRIREGEITPPSRRNPRCPPDLDRIVLAALERDPQRRMPTAGAFRHGLDEVARRLGIRISAREVAEWMVATSLTDPSRSFPGIVRTPTVSLSAIAAATENLRAPQSPDDDLLDGWAGDGAECAASLPQDRHNPGIPSVTGIPSLSDGVASMQPGTFAGAPYAPPLVVVRPSQQPRKNRVALYAIVGVLAVVAGGLAAVAVWKRGGAATEVATATVRFELQPADAIIEIGGREVSRSSPHEVTLEPGVYSIAIRKDGFVAQRSSLALRAGERQTVNLALEAAAPVAAAPAAPAAPPSADPQPEPAPIEMDPAPAPAPAPARPSKKTVKGKQRKDPEPDRVAASEPEPAPAPAPQPAPVVTAPPPPPTVPEVPPAPVKPARTPVVSAAAVTKLKGELPRIKSTSGEGASDVLAKICIDERGAVTGVTVKRSTPEIATQLQSALATWRYKPYVAPGATDASAVCVSMTLHIVPGR